MTSETITRAVVGLVGAVLGFILAYWLVFPAAPNLTTQRFAPTDRTYSVTAILDKDAETLQFSGDRDRCLNLMVRSLSEDSEAPFSLTTPGGTTLLRGAAVRNNFNVILPEEGNYLFRIGDEAGELQRAEVEIVVGKCP